MGGVWRMKNDEMLVTLCHRVHAESVSDRPRFARTQGGNFDADQYVHLLRCTTIRVMQAIEMRFMALYVNACQWRWFSRRGFSQDGKSLERLNEA